VLSSEPSYKEWVRLFDALYKGSTLFYELTMLFLGFLLLPLAIIHGYLRALVGLLNIKFGSTPQ
jgi:hypothetical protein